MEQQLLRVQQEIEMLKISHENDLYSKNSLIERLRGYLTKYEGIPTIEEFIKGASALSALLSKQKNLFFVQMSNIIPHL